MTNDVSPMPRFVLPADGDLLFTGRFHRAPSILIRVLDNTKVFRDACAIGGRDMRGMPIRDSNP